MEFFVKTDERLETLCEEFSNLEEPEKDYILGVSQTLAHSIKSKMPIAGIKQSLSKYAASMKENLA